MKFLDLMIFHMKAKVDVMACLHACGLSAVFLDYHGIIFSWFVQIVVSTSSWVSINIHIFPHQVFFAKSFYA